MKQKFSSNSSPIGGHILMIPVMNVAEMIIKAKDTCNEFWDNIESITDFVVPAYVRNILRLNGFDSASTVKLIDDDDLNKIDNFAKSGKIERILSTNADLSDFYGPFLNSKEDFHILQGHRKVILHISAFIREKGSQNLMKLIATRSINNNKTTYNERRNIFLKSSENRQVTKCNNSPTTNCTDSTFVSIASPIISSSSPIHTPPISSEKYNQSTLQNTSMNANQFKELKTSRVSMRRNCVNFESPFSCKTEHAVRSWNKMNSGKPEVNDPSNDAYKSSISCKENRPMKIGKADLNTSKRKRCG